MYALLHRGVDRSRSISEPRNFRDKKRRTAPMTMMARTTKRFINCKLRRYCFANPKLATKCSFGYFNYACCSDMPIPFYFFNETVCFCFAWMEWKKWRKKEETIFGSLEMKNFKVENTSYKFGWNDCFQLKKKKQIDWAQCSRWRFNGSPPTSHTLCTILRMWTWNMCTPYDCTTQQ